MSSTRKPLLRLVRSAYALGFAVALSLSLSPHRAIAAPASDALENCRATVGRPVVRACIQNRLHAQGGMPMQHLAACREIASPVVRSCFQTAMKDTIASCRASVGRPIVESCVGARVKSEGRFLFEFIAACRKSAYDAVKACVWRTSTDGDN